MQKANKAKKRNYQYVPMKNPTVQIKRLKKKDKNLCPCMFNLMTYVYKTVTVRFFMI